MNAGSKIRMSFFKKIISDLFSTHSLSWRLASSAFMMVLICLIAFLTPHPSIAKDVDKKLTQAQLNTLKKDIKSLKKSLSNLGEQKSSLEQKLQSVELKINKLGKDIFVLSEKIELLKGQHKQLQVEYKQIQAQLKEQQNLLSGQLKASYNMGKQEYLKLILNQQNPEVISRVITYYQYLNRARWEQIEEVKKLVIANDENRKNTQLKQQEIELQHHLNQEEKQKLESSQKERNKLISALSKEQKSKQAELKRLYQDEKRLNTLLKQLQKTLESLPIAVPKRSFAKSKGKMRWPTRGKLRRLFNHWRSVNKVRWQGVIINNKEASPVYSISHGRVAYADWLRGYGLLTIIDHGNGYMSLYGHNQSLLKEVGDWVDTGDIIAKTGRSGGRRKAGLYFEIRKNGRPINPTKWCKKMPRR